MILTGIIVTIGFLICLGTIVESMQKNIEQRRVTREYRAAKAKELK